MQKILDVIFLDYLEEIMKCEICGRDMLEVAIEGKRNFLCQACQIYHDPEKCLGENCPVCKEIRFLADQGLG